MSFGGWSMTRGSNVSPGSQKLPDSTRILGLIHKGAIMVFYMVGVAPILNVGDSVIRIFRISFHQVVN